MTDMGRFPPDQHAFVSDQGRQPVDGETGIVEIALSIPELP